MLLLPGRITSRNMFQCSGCSCVQILNTRLSRRVAIRFVDILPSFWRQNLIVHCFGLRALSVCSRVWGDLVS